MYYEKDSRVRAGRCLRPANLGKVSVVLIMRKFDLNMS